MAEIPKVNLFLVGAPKCGSTSLVSWLNQHPDIFFPKIKEPDYFNEDYKYRHTRTEAEYQSHYKAAIGHKIIGDASVKYASSVCAIENAYNYNNDAKFIIIIRNPVDMYRSLFYQNRYTRIESEKNIEKAWDEFVKKKKCGAEFNYEFLDYGRICSLGHQVANLMNTVPMKNILVLSQSELYENPRSALTKIFSILDIEAITNIELKSTNRAKTSKFPLLWTVVVRLNRFRKYIGLKRTGFGALFDSFSRKDLIVEPLSKELISKVQNYFGDDVDQLAKLIGEDLSSWKKDG